jgi:hypothetical protein
LGFTLKYSSNSSFSNKISKDKMSENKDGEIEAKPFDASVIVPLEPDEKNLNHQRMSPLEHLLLQKTRTN